MDSKAISNTHERETTAYNRSRNGEMNISDGSKISLDNGIRGKWFRLYSCVLYVRIMKYIATSAKSYV